jgi:hypothetical protein
VPVTFPQGVMLARPMERLPSGAALRGGGVYEPKWDGTPVRRHRDHSRQPTTTRKKTDRAVGQRARCSAFTIPHPSSRNTAELLDRWRATVTELRAVVT